SGRALHALPAGTPRRRSDVRGHRFPGLRRLRSGRESAPYAEGPAAAADRQIDRSSRSTRTSNISFVKPWLAHYDPDVRPSLSPYPHRTLVDYLDTLSKDNGTTTALLFKGSTVSYGRLDSESTAFAAALYDFGVRKGDRVA